MLTPTKLKVIFFLLDNEGHSGRDLAECLEIKESNLNPVLHEMEDMGILYQGPPRKSKKMKQTAKKGRYKEIPYYLSDNLEGIRILMKEIAQSGSKLDVGYTLSFFKRSKYKTDMYKLFKHDFSKTVADTLRKNYPPYTNPRFVVVQKLFNNNLIPPFLEADMCLLRELSLDEEIWNETKRTLSIALTSRLKGNSKKWFKILNNVGEHNKDHFYVIIGNLHKSLGEWYEAADCWKTAIKINPTNSFPRNNLGYYYTMKIKNYIDAEKLYRDSITAMPNIAHFYAHLGDALFFQGKYPEALEYYSQALEMPDDAFEYYAPDKMSMQVAEMMAECRYRTDAISHDQILHGSD